MARCESELQNTKQLQKPAQSDIAYKNTKNDNQGFNEESSQEPLSRKNSKLSGLGNIILIFREYELG